MKEYVGLYVIRHTDTKEIQYQSRQMFSEVIPENNTRDIIYCVAICNDNILEEYKGFEYIDMYGIVIDGVTELWENE